MKNSLLLLCFCVLFLSLQAQSPKWTWINGDSSAYNTLNYGTKGVEDINNNPGFLALATTWSDASGNIWLYSSSGTSAMWKYTNATGLWSWIAGSNTRSTSPVFGTQGVGAAANNPGPANGGNTWQDAGGNLWLFGGNSADINGNGYSNTLWKFNTSTLEWTWLSGDQSVNQPGVYGTKGVAAASNKPGSRSNAALAVDPSGNVWMFGGFGKDAFGTTNYLADLWKYNPATNQWTWISGPNSASTSGNYGTKGVAASGNAVPGRNYASAWSDASGRFWLFGGSGSGLFNDLWVYNPASQFWTWMNGDNITYMPGVYGTKGTAASGNKPGSRFSPGSWKDASGDLWLFGGSGFSELSVGNLNDVWKYTISTNQWTWMHGDNSAGGNGIYNTKGIADATGKPSGRFLFGSVGDASGLFWVYGGQGKDNYGNNGSLDDVWKFNSSTNQWTWLAGNKLIEKPGVYGTKGVAAAGNYPSKRTRSNAKSIGGKFWLFGGTGIDALGYGGYLNDLWRFDPAVGQWTWISGDNSVNQSAIYGTKGIANASNKPGSRDGGVTWKDATGNLWLFGGYGKDKNGATGDLNDLWKFDFTIMQWTWISGDDVVNQMGNYGSIGIAASGNKPGGRTSATGWTDASGNFWIFGGNGYGSSLGYLNDLWKYNITTGEWTWMAGNSTANATGSYGSKGVSDPANMVNAKANCTGWTDASGNLWLFGGTNNLNYFFNDLWKFNTTTNEWVWVSGDNTNNPPAVYGTQGIADINNKPSGRQEAMAYQNAAGHFILFGGRGFNASNVFARLSEVWEYNPNTNEWTWLSGTNTGNEPPLHGTLSVYSAANTPGARYSSATGDMDADGTMWLFSGSNSANDLWGALTGTILPLRFENFTATKKEKDVLLKWTTSEEKNTSYFDVQHSTDGIHFASIGMVRAKGLSRSAYSFIHKNPSKGKHLYRLQQIDADGHSSLSGIQLLTIEEASRLTWYLNNNTLFVRLTNGSNEPFELIDINGRIMKQARFTNGETQISQLPAGIYTIVVKANETISTRIVFY